MSDTFWFHISTSKFALKPLRFSLERDGLKWIKICTIACGYWRPNCTFKSHFLSNIHYIISFFSHKQDDQNKKKNLFHNPVKISNSFKNPKTLKSLLQTPISLQTSHPCYKSTSHYFSSKGNSSLISMIKRIQHCRFRQDPMQDYYKTLREK